METEQDVGVQITLKRLDNQIEYYDTSSIKNQRRYKTLKIVEIGAAALIPFAAFMPYSQFSTSLLGVIVVFTEGIQQVYQFHANWISYRSTCEALRHEKFLFLARAGPYSSSPNPDILLAERVESNISVENANWVSCQENTKESKKSG
ncbi:MAG: DUF4231 domain-containing protein [Methanomassiliicoccus sp.]|nr:DUF4231 domain-containing protein [Methanomassiliicoccus sp.]